MKKILALALVCGSLAKANAQTWKVNMESGFNVARLIPAQGSTTANGSLHYRYTKPGVYLAPELQLRLNDNWDAGFCYQYSNIAIGTMHSAAGTHIRVNDKIDMHQVALSVRAHKSVFNDKLTIGAFGKLGFAYSKLVAMSAGGGSGGVPEMSQPIATGSGMSRTDDFSIMQGAWIPTITVGLSLAPKCPGLGDRLSFNWAMTIGWSNLYDKPASYDYYINYSNNTTERGTVRYQGKPFVMQFGMSYRLFGFGRKD